MSRFERCVTAKYSYGIIDLVSRKWIAAILAAVRPVTCPNVSDLYFLAWMSTRRFSCRPWELWFEAIG